MNAINMLSSVEAFHCIEGIVGPEESFCRDLTNSFLMWIVVIVKTGCFYIRFFYFVSFYSWHHTQVSTKINYDRSCPQVLLLRIQEQSALFSIERTIMKGAVMLIRG